MYASAVAMWANWVHAEQHQAGIKRISRRGAYLTMSAHMMMRRPVTSDEKFRGQDPYQVSVWMKIVSTGLFVGFVQFFMTMRLLPDGCSLVKASSTRRTTALRFECSAYEDRRVVLSRFR